MEAIMSRKNSGGDDGGGSEWLNTYADMVTLLLTFFAVLLSMSSVNQEKFNAFIKSFSNLPPEKIEEIISGTNPDFVEGAKEPTPQQVAEAMDQLYEMLMDYVQKNGMNDTISLQKNEDTIYIRFDSTVFFEPDKYIMRPGGYDTLSFIGDGLKQYEEMIKLIAICGHTATVGDIPDYPVSDWMLSAERAAIVGIYLDKEKNLDPKKMLLLGYGKNLPISDNDTEEGRIENRRVELAVIGIGSDISFDPYAGLSDLYTMSGGTPIDSAKSEGADAKQTPPATKPPAESKSPAETTKPGTVQEGVSPYD
jgi:chemotaxis protein MotB